MRLRFKTFTGVDDLYSGFKMIEGSQKFVFFNPLDRWRKGLLAKLTRGLLPVYCSRLTVWKMCGSRNGSVLVGWPQTHLLWKWGESSKKKKKKMKQAKRSYEWFGSIPTRFPSHFYLSHWLSPLASWRYDSSMMDQRSFQCFYCGPMVGELLKGTAK